MCYRNKLNESIYSIQWIITECSLLLFHHTLQKMNGSHHTRTGEKLSKYNKNLQQNWVRSNVLSLMIAYPKNYRKGLHTIWNINMTALHWVIPKCKLLPFVPYSGKTNGSGICSRVICIAGRNSLTNIMECHLRIIQIVCISNNLFSAY